MAILIGAALLLVLGADVFLTVFHPAGRGGPYNRVQNRTVWALFRSLGVRADGTPRDGLLSLGGAVLIVLTLIFWILWLVVGFALIYYPFVSDFLVSPGSVRASWAEALYYSGYTAATLGLGDLVPDRQSLRLLTVVEAFCGFALLSVAVTYLLAVYRELITVHKLAVSISGYFEAGDVQGLVVERPTPAESVARWAERVNDSILHVLQAHHQYPILHYFRAADPARALPVQIGKLLELRRADRRRLSDPHAEQTSGPHQSLASLWGAVETYIDEVNTRFIPASVQVDEIDPESDNTERAHARLLRYMRFR